MSFATTPDSEWGAIADALETAAGRPFDAEAGWRDLLDGHYPAGVLLAAVKRLVLAAKPGRGNDFPLTALAVAAEANLIVQPETAPVSWAELWRAFRAAGVHPDFPRGDTSGARAVFVGERVAGELGPIAGNYAATLFVDRSPEEPDGRRLDAWRREFEEYQGVWRDRALRSVPIPEPRQVLSRTERVQLPAGRKAAGQLAAARRRELESGETS